MSQYNEPSYYNPFHEIYYNESDAHPHAKTLRSSFSRKLKDTFFVFAGNLSLGSEESKHIGLFDYLIPVLPLLIMKWAEWCMKTLVKEGVSTTAGKWAAALVAPALILNFIPGLLRYAFAAVATLAVSFLVVIAHGLASAWNAFLGDKAKVLTIEVSPFHANENENDSTSLITSSLTRASVSTLEELLDETGLELDDLDIGYDQNSKHYTFHDKTSDNALIARATTKERDLNDFSTLRTPYDSLFQLNVGGLSRKSEGTVFENEAPLITYQY